MTNDPVQAEVRLIPETGSIKPYEVWLRTADGRWYQRGSFGREATAIAKARAVAKMFSFSYSPRESA